MRALHALDDEIREYTQTMRIRLKEVHLLMLSSQMEFSCNGVLFKLQGSTLIWMHMPCAWQFPLANTQRRTHTHTSSHVSFLSCRLVFDLQILHKCTRRAHIFETVCVHSIVSLRCRRPCVLLWSPQAAAGASAAKGQCIQQLAQKEATYMRMCEEATYEQQRIAAQVHAIRTGASLDSLPPRAAAAPAAASFSMTSADTSVADSSADIFKGNNSTLY